MNFLGTADHRRAGVRRAHLRMLRSDSRAAGEASGSAAQLPTEPLRALEPQAADGAAAERRNSREQAERRNAREHSRILIAGADPERRAAVLADLTEALPADTQFGEAGAAWEVLEQAPSSGVVMLAGDLDEVTAESLMHVLGHRHPSLPVVALGLFADGGSARGGQLGRTASATG